MNNVKAIFCKQFKSMLKSPVMLGQAGGFLVIALLMMFFASTFDDRDCDDCIVAYHCADCLETNPALNAPSPSIMGLFTVFFVGMVMIGSASALVSEDRSTKNLRFMAMANVKPTQYFVGTFVCMLMLSFGVLVIYAMAGRYFGAETFWFLLATTTGVMVSILLGLAVGMSKKPGIAVPVSMILGMGPMLSSFNENLASILRFTYTQQVNWVMSDLYQGVEIDFRFNFMIIGINGLLAAALFIWVNRKGKLQY